MSIASFFEVFKASKIKSLHPALWRGRVDSASKKMMPLVLVTGHADALATNSYFS
jgi:hypothetical protein